MSPKKADMTLIAGLKNYRPAILTLELCKANRSHSFLQNEMKKRSVCDHLMGVSCA